MKNLDFISSGGNSGGEYLERQTNTETEIGLEVEVFDKNLQEVSEKLKGANLEKLTPGKKQLLLDKGGLIVASIFKALGAAGVGFFGYEVWNREGFDTPEKALVALGIFLAGLASANVAAHILNGKNPMQNRE